MPIITNDADAIAVAQEAAGDIQEVLQYWEAAHPSDAVVRALHQQLSRLAARFEMAVGGASAGTLSNPRPNDGVPKT